MAGDPSRTIAAGAGRMLTGQVCNIVAYASRSGGIAKADIDRFDQANRNRGEKRANQARRDRMRRSIVCALASSSPQTRRRTRRARLHHLLRCVTARDGEKISDEFNRVPPHSGRRRTETEGFWRSVFKRHPEPFGGKSTRSILKRCRFYVPKPRGLA